MHLKTAANIYTAKVYRTKIYNHRVKCPQAFIVLNEIWGKIKFIGDLNTMNKFDLIDIYRTLFPTSAEYTFL